MALSATFTANFSSFYDAVDKADVKLKDFGQGADKVGGRLATLSDSFSGRKIIQEATLMAKAVEEVGGVTNLTEKELARLGATTNEAVAKMKALGLDVPKNIQKIADETSNANKKTTDWVGTLGTLAAAAGVAFSLDAVKGFIGSVFDAASAVKDLSDQWGISTTAVQQFVGAAKASGVESDKLGKSIQFLTTSLAESSPEFDALLANVGLSGQKLRELPMEDAYREVIKAIGGVEDQTLQLDVAIGLLGPSSKQMLGAIRDGFLENAAAMDVMTEATIRRLEHAQAIWEAFANSVTVHSGEALGKVVAMTSSWSNFGDVMKHIIAGDIAGAGLALEGVAAKTDANALAAEAGAIAARGLGSAHADLAPKVRTTSQVLADEKAKTEDAKKATEAHTKATEAHAKAQAAADKVAAAYVAGLQAEAKAIADIAYAFGGGGLVDKANKYVEALKVSIPIEQMTAAAQADINKTMQDAIEVYLSAGEVIPEAMLAAWNATHKTNVEMQTFRDNSAELENIINSDWMRSMVAAPGTMPTLPGATTPGSAPRVNPFAAPSAAFTKSIGEMTDAFERMANISEDAFGHIAAEIANVSAAMNTAAASGNTFRGGLNAIKTGNTTEGLVGMVAGAVGVASAFQEATKNTDKLHSTLNGAAIGFSVAGPWGAAVGAAAGLIKGFFNAAKDRKELINMRADFIAAAGGIDQLNVAARDAGMKLDDLLKAKNTDAFKKAVEELNQGWKDQQASIQLVEETAAKYGITLDELGPIFQKQKLDQQAQELYRDWEILNAAGLDTVTISDKMSGSINDYVRNAQHAGIEIPESMRDIIQKMIENKELVDDNGVAYEDMEEAGITFTMSLTRGFTLLIAEVEKLTNTIVKSLTPAIEDVPSLPAVDVYRGGNDPGLIGRGNKMPAYATGTDGYVNFGKGTPVMLHGWEAVVPKGDSASLATVAGGAMAAGSPAVNVNVVMNNQGAFFDTPDSLQRLAARVSDALTAKFSVMGKLRAAV